MYFATIFSNTLTLTNTQHYISQCFGTYMVGFVLIVLGLCSSLSSVAIGRFLKYLPRFAIVLFGASLSVTTILFMVMWQREPSFVAFFVIAAVWGSADAVWTTVPTSRLPTDQSVCVRDL